MKYQEIGIQTQREAPNNARTEGFAFLVRAGHLSRENVPTNLGKHALIHLGDFSEKSLSLLPTIGNENETFFHIGTGDLEIAHCTSCKYTERLELAKFTRNPLPQEEILPLEKVSTPGCNTIESLANYLNLPKERTAKALMYTRITDGKFIFVIVRGDMQLSEAKLKERIGEVRTATEEEIIRAGAIPGYASAIGLKDALIVVDDLIPKSQNLVAGANDSGWHFKNTNYGRDYSAHAVADLTQVREGDDCPACGNPLSALSAISLATHTEYHHGNILLALAEAYHDDRGLTLPHPAAPFDVYLMNVPGREMDTLAAAEEIYKDLQNSGIAVLFDDRDERAGVKFNDADLIGCPVRLTVGEKGLKVGMVELKPRTIKENQLVSVDEIIEKIKSSLR